MEKFDCTYKYKLIYVFSMPYDTHKGLLKIGEATLTTDTKPEYLTPNCRESGGYCPHQRIHSNRQRELQVGIYRTGCPAKGRIFIHLQG